MLNDTDTIQNCKNLIKTIIGISSSSLKDKSNRWKGWLKEINKLEKHSEINKFLKIKQKNEKDWWLIEYAYIFFEKSWQQIRHYTTLLEHSLECYTSSSTKWKLIFSTNLVIIFAVDQIFEFIAIYEFLNKQTNFSDVYRITKNDFISKIKKNKQRFSKGSSYLRTFIFHNFNRNSDSGIRISLIGGLFWNSWPGSPDRKEKWEILQPYHYYLDENFEINYQKEKSVECNLLKLTFFTLNKLHSLFYKNGKP